MFFAIPRPTRNLLPAPLPSPHSNGAMPAPVLFVGDMHLGRTPTHLRGLDAHLLGPAEAWRRVVDSALGDGVQAVVLAGDVVDQDKDRFEAWSVLREGVSRLVSGGVRVLGVAGNHDYLALPRLAQRIPEFHLLGRGGRWERVELDGLDLVGWSFPGRHHRLDPLLSEGLDASIGGRRQGLPAVGVLHGDLDVAQSPYAPVRSSDLRAQGLDGWFLGHVHQPGDLGAEAPVGYLGSVVGLGRGEEGRRGPWRVSLTPSGRLSATQLALGPLLWKAVAVDFGGIEPGSDAVDRMMVRTEAMFAVSAKQDTWLTDGTFDAVGVTLTIRGRTSARAAVGEFCRLRDDPSLAFDAGGVPHVVVRVRDLTRPEVDLDAIAKERSPLGRLAALIRDLEERGQAGIPPRVAQAFARFDPGPWTPDPGAHPLPSELSVVRRAAMHLLDQLMVQRGRQGAG